MTDGGEGTARHVIGRDAELARIDTFLEQARAGSAVLDLVGDAGIGKTTLLDATAERARAGGMRVLAARPTPTEASFSYAALGDLLDAVVPPGGPVHGTLPQPQREALDAALMRATTADRSLEGAPVAAAVRTVLQRLAEERPLIVAIDDRQWLDRASEDVLSFAFRRLGGHRIGVVIGRRLIGPDDRPTSPLVEPSDESSTLVVDRLSLAALYRIIEERLGIRLSRRQLDQIERLSAGNPFYALEIARTIRETPPGGALRLPAHAADALRDVLDRLPSETRLALVRAAAHRAPTGAEVSLDALDAAERAGIVAIDDAGRVRFTHPTWSLTAYESAPAADRRAAHRALAEIATEPEERARHRALGSDGPDLETADILDEASRRAESRGAAQAATEMAELAFTLTPATESGARLDRMLRLGKLLSLDDLARAGTVLEEVVATAPRGAAKGEALLELAIIAYNLGDVPLALKRAQHALNAWDEPRFQGLVHARMSWMVADRVDRAADEARLALETLDPDEDRELVGFALLYQAQWGLLAGRGADQEALARGRELTEGTNRSWLTPTVGATWAKMLDDFPTARELYAGYLEEGEAAGDDISMASNLANLAEIAARTGDLPEAERLIERAIAIGSGMGSATWEAVALGPAGLIDALRGRHDEARARADRILELIEGADEPLIEAHARAIRGFLALTEGDPVAADQELTRADDGLRAMGIVEPAPYRFHADHVEAVVALGDLDRAEELTARLEMRRSVVPKPWTVVMAARAQGLVHAARGDLEAAQASAEAALRGHRELDMPFERARDLVLLGVLLRRRRRRTEAATLLLEAVTVFERLGSPRWAERARNELDRLGTSPGEASRLTPSEERIARMAASGLTNRDVASRLRISPKTVEANLSRAYGKLGIRTRAELGRWASESTTEDAKPSA
jgi:DNA-binding CsgD family transcriptional regulator